MTTPNIILCAADASDAALIAATVRTAFEEHRGKIDPPSSSREENEDAVVAKLEKGGGVLAYIDGALAGVVLYYPADDGSIYLGRLAVLEDFRRFGVGKALVDAVEASAQAKDYTRVTLAVRIALTRNRTFFERLGYQISSYEKHAGHDQPTFMIMAKSI